MGNKATYIKWVSILVFVNKINLASPDGLNATDPLLGGEGSHAPRPMWNYIGDHGFDRWCAQFEFAACCHSQQSPINIVRKKAQYKQMDLYFGNYELPPKKLILTNDGHTALMTFDSDYIPYISNGPLGNNTQYILDNIHFHWGSQDHFGSEHTIDGKTFPLEMHFVHRDPIYPNCMDAEDHSDGIAVISVLFKVRKEDNANYRELVYNLKNIRYKGEKKVLKSFSLGSLLPPHYYFYFTYNGSLTTPPCTETVKWIIFHEPVYISEYQLDAFRFLQQRTRGEVIMDDASDLFDNFRPVQSIGARNVLWSKEYF